MGAIAYKGTTPDITFVFPSNLDMTDAQNVVVTFIKPITFVDGDPVIEVIFELLSDSLGITEHTIGVYLTQEQTLAMPTGTVLVQFNWIYWDGENLRRGCTEMKEIYWKPNAHDSVMGIESEILK